MSDAMKSAMTIETESDEKPKAAPVAPKQAMVQKASVAPAATASNKHKPSNTAAIEALDVLAEQGSDSQPATEAPAKAAPAMVAAAPKPVAAPVLSAPAPVPVAAPMQSLAVAPAPVAAPVMAPAPVAAPISLP